MRTILTRVRRLEDLKQTRVDREPYELVSPCGRVKATVTPIPGRAPAVVAYSDPTIYPDDARAVVNEMFPDGWSGFLFPRVCDSVEEWERHFSGATIH